MATSAADKVADQLIAMQRDIDALKRAQRAPQLGHSSLDGKPFVIRDEDGNVRQVLGRQNGGEVYTTVDVNGPPPPQLSGVTVTAIPGGFKVHWNGTFVGGAARPVNFQRADVHVDLVNGFVPTPETADYSIYLPDGGEVIFASSEYQPHYVRLIAVNSAQKSSEPTAQVAVTPAKLGSGDLAPNSVGSVQLQNGSVGETQLKATIILGSRLIIGTIEVDGITNEIKAFRPDGITRTFHVDGDTGDVSIIGSIQTSGPGGRVVVGPNGERLIAFLPVTGDLAAIIQSGTQTQDGQQHGTIEMRAADPSNGSFDTTRLDLRMDSLFLGYGHLDVANTAGTIIAPSHWSGQIYIDPDTAYLRAGIPVIFSDRKMGPFDVNQTHFRHMDASGNFIFAAEIRHQLGFSNWAALVSAAQNCGIVFGRRGTDASAYITYGDGETHADLTLRTLFTGSAPEGKERVEDISWSALRAVRAAPVRMWERPDAPPPPATSETGPSSGHKKRNKREGEYLEPEPEPSSSSVMGATGQGVGAVRPPKAKHIGPMATDLPPELVHDCETAPGGKVIDLGSMNGFALKAIQELADKLDASDAQLEKALARVATLERQRPTPTTPTTP